MQTNLPGSIDQHMLETLLAQSAAMHKHLCPRQVLGVRMGMLAGRILGLDLPQTDKRLFTFVEMDGCGADGVSVATGCWVGRRTLRVMDYGKLAATFVDTKTMQAVRIHPHSEARQLAADYAEDETRSRWHRQLVGYQRMPDEALLIVQPVELSVSLQAIISRPGVRVNCTACGEEITNEREVWMGDAPYCRACAGEGYYHVVAVPVIECAFAPAALPVSAR
ncbi:MAG: FmdE family protein [Anaerolineae bacterium]